MFIAIDIGNTSTVLGLYRKEILVAECRLTSTLRRTEKILFAEVQTFLANAGTTQQKIDGIGISSVVPKLTKVYAAMSKKYFHQKPMIVSADLNLGITNRYDAPASLGADRICSAVAGFTKYGGPLIIIDFGTATTYDVIDSNGDFLGGVIAPGIETSALSLHHRTAKLPRLAGKILQFPKTVIGTTTAGSMQAGILWGAVDAMAGMVNRIQQELRSHRSKKASVIATGGFSTLIAKHTRVIRHVEPTLVLDGIRLIYQRTKI